MTNLCSYHPTQTAWWQCPRCHKHLCPQCIVHRKGGFQDKDHYYLCPKCHIVSRPVDMTNIIQPFWKRLHRCFAYPFGSIQSIGLILGLALLSVFFAKPGLLYLLLQFLVWAVMVKYSYEALRLTADGRFGPPPLSKAVLSDNFGIVFKQICLFIALGLLYIFVISGFHPLLQLLYGLGVFIGLPAMILLLATNEDVGQALNPLRIAGVIFQIGWGYALLFFFLFLLQFAPGALGKMVIQHLPQWGQHFLWIAAQNYYTLVTYHLLGYVILQYHKRLAYPLELETLMESFYPDAFTGEQATTLNSETSIEDAIVQAIGPLVQEGELDQAIDLIEERTDLDIQTLALSKRYFKLLKMCQRQEAFLEHLPRHLDLLVADGEKQDAIKLYLWSIKNKVNLAIGAPVMFKLAGWLDEARQFKPAIQAFSRLTQYYPNDALVPKAYFRGAQILNEKMKQRAKAVKILKGLIAKFPNHDISDFARKYLAGI